LLGSGGIEGVLLAQADQGQQQVKGVNTGLKCGAVPGCMGGGGCLSANVMLPAISSTASQASARQGR
jgi:hypothetical protein